MQQKIGSALLTCLLHIAGHRLRIQRGRIDIKALAGFETISYQHTQRQRESRDNLEIQQGFDPNSPGFFHVISTSNPQYDGAKHHRTYQHLDQADKAVADGF